MIRLLLATVIEWWTAQGSPERRKLEELVG